MKYFQYDFLVRLVPPKYTEKSTFRSLEMHSKRPYKIVSCICSVILHDPRELESFRNYKGFSITFPKILGAI